MLQPMLFVPALSLSEAEARLTAIAGGKVSKSRGPKRVLRTFADDLGLAVPMAATNGALGGAIAASLGAPWPSGAYTSSGQVTLAGLNLLLEHLEDHYARHPTPTPTTLPAQFATPGWSWFRPARSKIEAVNQIANLTNSGPEYLGPGGKERKSVLENLVLRSGLQVNTSQTKTNLGAAIARTLGVTWTPTCGSTGETITLEGLNVILAGATRHVRSQGAATPSSPLAEAKDMLSILHAEFGARRWDGQSCVKEMRDDAFNQWRGTEWPGWYFEYRGLRALHAGVGPRPANPPAQAFGKTTFDFAHRYVWDLKSHGIEKRMEPSGTTKRMSSGNTPLNDTSATDLCVSQYGVGILVLEGANVYDETGAFEAWHRGFVAKPGQKPFRANSANKRDRKSAFVPLSISAYRFDDTAALDDAKNAGAIKFWKQPPQPPSASQVRGTSRRPKYQLSTAKASPWLLHRVVL